MTAYSTWERPWAPLDPTIVRVANSWFRTEIDPERPPAPVGLLVGEQPGPSNRSDLPLWPYPPRSAGGRLHEMSGMSTEDYLARLARVNLSRRATAAWSVDQGQHRAHQLLGTLPDGARVVLLGARARAAVPAVTELGWWRATVVPVTAGHAVVVAAPHPSGRCREYNDPEAVLATGRAVRWAAGME